MASTGEVACFGRDKEEAFLAQIKDVLDLDGGKMDTVVREQKEEYVRPKDSGHMNPPRGGNATSWDPSPRRPRSEPRDGRTSACRERQARVRGGWITSCSLEWGGMNTSSER